MGLQVPVPWHMVKERVGPVVVEESSQPVPPVKLQVPVITFPFSFPVKVRVFPAGVPDCTVNDKGPVATLFVVVTLRVPLAEDPETKQLPMVRNSMPETLSEPSPFTVNVVTKLSVEASPVPPVNTACQVPLAVAGAVLVLLLLLPQPERVDARARSATTGNRFMFTLDVGMERGSLQRLHTGMRAACEWM